MSIAHNLGFPRIGADRELKKATEAFWQDKIACKSAVNSGYATGNYRPMPISR